jgi:hypothetical protein
MPTDHIVWSLLKLTGVSGMSIGGVFLAAANLSGDPDFDKYIVAVRELTSFAIIGILVLGAAFLIYKIIPVVAEFLSNLTERHLEELQKEREARERSLVDFREMLRAHSEKVAEKIDDQTDALKMLCKEVSGRPCQIPNLKRIASE